MSLAAELFESFHRFACADPNARVTLGLEDGLGELPDPSLDHIAARATQAQALASRARAVDRQGLDFDQALDLDLMALNLDLFVHRASLEPGYSALPQAGDGIADPLFMLLVNDPRPDGARLDDVLGRLQDAPRYLAQMAERVDRPVERWRAIERQKIAGLAELFDVVRAWAERAEYPHLRALDAATRAALDAAAAYDAALAAKPAREAFAIGDAAARKLVKLRGIDASFEELHAMARDFLAETAEAIERLRTALAARHGLAETATTEEVEAYLEAKFAVPVADDEPVDKVLARYEAERARILDFIAARDLFPIPADQDMLLVRTPSFLEPSIPAGAMAAPAPFRKGTAKSIVYLTIERSRLGEHTELGIPVMMIHEGIPGHHLQLSHAARHPSVVRRHMDTAELAEGWTTMLEDYMLDQGYLAELRDEARFITKRDMARLGARVAIDLFFMTGDAGYLEVGVDFDRSSDDPFALAGALLRKVTGFSEARTQAELNWYSIERGYPLSYLAGNRLVWALKRDVQASPTHPLEGTELDRAFHRTYLEAGNMPVSFLRRVFEREGLIPAQA
jgi:uncharacterized protein (DUF885 family)